jgi:molybdopterin-containing oxidoreductase family membrane subunit
MTHYNFKSIFAWNIFLYTGFIFVAILYLWTMFERGLNRYTPNSGLLAFIWRFVLTSGTGSIFGFLVARQFFDAAIMVPIFIVLSLVLGTAIFILTSLMVSSWARSPIGQDIIERLGRLLAIFIAVELFLVAVFHITNLYATEHHGIEQFILVNGGYYTGLFWIGQVLIGGALPLGVVFLSKTGGQIKGVVTASCLAIIGVFCQLYVTIIGGQAFPLVLFPGKTVSSSFYDGVVAPYAPSLPELLLGLGGIGLSLLLLMVALRVLPFLPDDRAVKAHA